MDEIRWSHLFIAAPELTFNIQLIELMVARGYITQRQADQIGDARRALRKAGKLKRASLRGEGLINRMLAVGGEFVTVETVNLFRAAGILNETQGHALRIAVRTLSVGTRGGLPTDAGQIFTRLMRIIGVQISQERIDMWSSMGLISAQEADRWRAYLRSGTVVQESLAKAKRAKNLLDALMILGEIPTSKRMISGLVQAGMITPRLGRVYNSLVDLGVKEWKVFSGAGAAEGWRRRALLVLTGSLNAELLDYLVTTKIITRQQWASLQIAEIIARRVNDTLLEDMIRRRYRVKPGEAPIKTFARASRTSEGELLHLLATAAQEARKEAAALAAFEGVGADTRSRQYRLAAAGLHQTMRSLWDGVGYLTIWGERETSEAAVESVYAMNRSLLKGRFSKLNDSILWQAKAGVDSYISREEYTLELSRRVYNNVALYSGLIDKRIKIGLLQGNGPQEIATDIYKYISPRVPGGVSYAAMRLARTEINNAFLTSTIRYTRENPWVRGYKWNLSGSHGRPDICNEYAEKDHDGLGDGVFKKANVPGKPHPQCLCYVTTVQMSEDEFVSAYRAGRFNKFLNQLSTGQAYDAPDSASLAVYARSGAGNFVEALRNQ